MKLQIVNTENQLPTYVSKEDAQIGNAILYYLLENWKGLVAKYTKGKTETGKTYKYNAEHFISYITENGVTPNILHDYAQEMMAMEVNLATRKARGTAAKRLIYWAHKEDVRLINREMYHHLTDDVKFHTAQEKQPKKQRSNRTIIRDIKTVVDSIEDRDDMMDSRTQFYILSYCGLRVSELCRLKLSNIDFQNNCITVKRKGGIKKSTDVFTVVLEQIKRHKRNFELSNDDYLFTKRKGKQTGQKLDRFQMAYRWKKIFKLAGVKCSLHDLRHYAASNLAEITNGNPYVISGVLGHDNISTSQAYVSDWAKKNKLKEVDSFLLNEARKNQL